MKRHVVVNQKLVNYERSIELNEMTCGFNNKKNRQNNIMSKGSSKTCIGEFRHFDETRENENESIQITFGEFRHFDETRKNAIELNEMTCGN